MLANFSGSGHPVFRASNNEAEEEGRSQILFDGGHENIDFFSEQ